MKLSIQHEDEMRFKAISDQHEVTIDLPIPLGGTNQGMTPPELFIASLGACVGVYVVDFCETEEFNYQNMRVDLDWKMALNPKRIKQINIHIDLPELTLSDQTRVRLLAVINKCLVHNTLHNAPEINTKISEREPQELV